MFIVDPAAMMLTSVLVSLVTMLVLLLSPTGAEQRESIRLWVAGDVLGITARLAMLGLREKAISVPHGLEAISAALIIGAAVLHALALRSTLGQPAGRRTLLAALAAALCCALLSSSMVETRNSIQVVLIGMLLADSWTARIAIPWRRRSRGALLISIAMGIFAMMTVAALIQIRLTPPQQAPRMPPLAGLLMDMLTSLAFTMGFLMTQFELLHHQIAKLSNTDPLTGALNRRGFIQGMRAIGGDSTALPLSLAIFDLDHFKRINDSLGHSCGDDVITGFVRRVQKVTRNTDVLGRWGGEEFVLLMPCTGPVDAMHMAERVRAAVAATPLALRAPQVTVSAGIVTSFQPALGSWIDELLARADASLYRAKQARNCVVAWQEDTTTSATKWPGQTGAPPPTRIECPDPA